MYSRKLTFFLGLFLMLFACKSSELNRSTPQLDIEYSNNNPLGLNITEVSFASNISYDDHSNTAFDIFLPRTTTPTSLAVFIHGGGFTGGYKEQAYERYQSQIKEFISRDIAFATIDYRLLHETDKGVITSLMDSKRCLQFIKYYSSSFNIDKDRIAVFGSSAGAGTALWIGLSDEMASAKNIDPVLKESSKVKAIGAIATQATYDILRWEEVFADYDLSLDNIPDFLVSRLTEFYGVDEREALQSEKIVAYRNNVDMLQLMDKDDPPIWVKNEQQDVPPLFDLQHHPAHAKLLKERADKIGLANIVYAPALGIEDETEEGLIDFLDRILSTSKQ